ncbi:Uncharacterised protein [BD1-7 clade bacterium]|uniref:Heparan-alpha-glucosaminide N-acetyltransferase catalytic domain-containing protein n=1 Tax=BD1-7 clade bacterium TaxID=2029982 RepID=A0A5S9MYD1_9GAMM|nr:Uncharacterised protein [BD1-7 clade bacterium]
MDNPIGASHTAPVNTSQRYTLLDYARALAIVLMLIYHFMYDLAAFHYIRYETFTSVWATVIGRSCLILFLICVGYSLGIAHPSGIRWNPFWRRWLKIAGAACLVSLGTYLSNQSTWIYFGILHNIALSSILGLFFLRIPYVALPAGLALMLAYYGWDYSLPWIRLSRPSLDYIPLFPWFGSVLIGIGLTAFQLHKKYRPRYSRPVEWLSQKSLIIYLVHQPLLMGAVWVFKKASMVL